MIFIIAIVFTIYNFSVFYFSRILYNRKVNLIPYLIVFTPINFFIVYVSIYITKFQYDYLVMLAFLLIYAAEFMIVFKQPVRRALFGTLSYAINVFSMRVILIASFALYKQIPIIQLIDNLEFRLFVTAVTFAIRPFTILTAMRFVNKEQIFLIFREKNNLLFALGIFLITFFYQSVSTLILYVESASSNASFFLLASGFFAEAVYICAMVHTFEFSRLKEHMNNTEHLKNEVKKEQERLDALKLSAEIDPFTGTYIRSSAEEKLMHNVAANLEFSVIFIDIDGLKITNDEYGHEEGDFYIKEVARLLFTHFPNDFIARLGGDEFVVITECTEEVALNKAISLFNNSLEIAQNYKKQYDTSISYGVQFVDIENTYSAKEILAMADKKMYEFKRARRKERTGKGANGQ